MQRKYIENPEKWSEARIGRAIVRAQLFHHAILAIPCCGWTGHEADLLVVQKDLRLIDVEVKISRADLKADLKKDKWWHHKQWRRSRLLPGRQRLEWPPKIWKHYYALPGDIWDPALEQFLPKTSGILLLKRIGFSNGPQDGIAVWRRATPNKDAQKIQPHDCIDLARLAGLRMWDALQRADRP